MKTWSRIQNGIRVIPAHSGWWQTTEPHLKLSEGRLIILGPLTKLNHNSVM